MIYLDILTGKNVSSIWGPDLLVSPFIHEGRIWGKGGGVDGVNLASCKHYFIRVHENLV